MATVSDDVIGTADEAIQVDPVEDLLEPQGAVESTPSGNEADNYPRSVDIAGGSVEEVPRSVDTTEGGRFQTSVPVEENWERELTTYKSNDGSTVVNEPCVVCVVTDETDSDWQRSRYNYSMPLSSSVTDLYSAIAKEAGYVEGTFDLFWRKQETTGPAEEQVPLDWKSTATLHEMAMPSEPTKGYLLIKEKDGVTPQRLPSSTSFVTTSGAAGGVATSESSQPSTKVQAWNNTSYYPSASASSYSSYTYHYSSYNTKSDTGFVGLVNQAMTCYLNSLLQTLYMTPEFRNALYSWLFTKEGNEVKKSIPYQLQRLFIQLQTSNKRAVETTDVTKSFGWDSSEAWQQHDVQELCRVMFDALEKTFRRDQQQGQGGVRANLINELYQGTMKDYVKCLKCGYESAREDHFLDIPLVIKPFGSQQAYGSVAEALHGFTQPETLEGDNQYFCELCNAKQDAHKGLKFTRFPYLLTLQLKRFDFDYSTMHRMKLNDRMSFPKVMDLNGFIDPAVERPPVPENIEQRYRDFVVEHFDPPPYSSYSSSSRTSYGSTSYDSKYSSANSSYTIRNMTETSASPSIQISNDSDAHDSDAPSAESHDQSHDLNKDNNGEEEGEGRDRPNDPHSGAGIATLLKQGPYVYELFSIMVHSGSAIGGHYYAYIKSFTDKRWYCFNDQSVLKITEEDIQQTFGGADTRSRGYYSSMYASSANAYMLMYRRIDLDENKPFITTEELPEHITRQIEEEKEQERREKERQEWEKNLCKFRLFCKHPGSGELVEKCLEVHKDRKLMEATWEAYHLLNLTDHVPIDRCRLVKYDEYTEALDQSFEEQEGATFGQLVGGARQHYSYELFMEIRAEGEVFKLYKKGGLNLKVLVIDVATGKVFDPVHLRAEQTWKIGELKEEISEKLHLDADTMSLALETYQNEGKHLPNAHQLLKNEGFYRKHTVFVCCDPEDFKLDFKESKMNAIIDRHANSILLHVTVPPPPRKKLQSSTCVDPPAANGVGEGEDWEAPTNQGETEDTGGEPGSHEDATPTQSVEVEEMAKSQPGETQQEADQGQERSGERTEDDSDRPLRRTIQVRIDRRRTLADLKMLLEEEVQQTSDNFKIYRMYNNNQEYEMFRLTDSLSTVPNETQLIVRLGRALKPGEFRIRLSLLRMREVEFYKPLLDSIVAKGMTVREFKEQIVKECYEQGVEFPLHVDRVRLRKKTWRSAGTVYLDDQVFEKDIHVFANFEMYVEPLEAVDPMVYPTQMQVYVRHWRPSTYAVDPTSEIILSENTPEHLRKMLSEASGIPWKQVEFAKGYGSFPCEMSVLEVEDDLDWNPNVQTISSMPLSIYDDGAIVYFKDSAEKLADLSSDRRSEIQKQEQTRLAKFNIHGSTSYNYRYHSGKERALKIYTDDDDNAPDIN